MRYCNIITTITTKLRNNLFRLVKFTLLQHHYRTSRVNQTSSQHPITSLWHTSCVTQCMVWACHVISFISHWWWPAAAAARCCYHQCDVTTNPHYIQRLKRAKRHPALTDQWRVAADNKSCVLVSAIKCNQMILQLHPGDVTNKWRHNFTTCDKRT